MKQITKCRACGSNQLIDFLDLGKQYISDFRDDDSKPPKYPLKATMCDSCKLVQLRHTTPQAEMYHENYGFKSGISDSIRTDLQDVVYHTQSWFDSPKSWLDIACNDGTLLSYVPTSATRVGVDPIKFLAKQAKQYANLVINDFFSWEAISMYPQTEFDVVTSISCFYDMPDPNKFVSDVKKVMHDKTVWTIQQNYLLPTLQMGALDNFCHEHLEYYSLLSLENLLEKFGLEVFDLTTSMVNGGSIRTLVCKKGAYPIQESVGKQFEVELAAELDKPETYFSFSAKAKYAIEALKTAVAAYKKVYILAASTRGATIWQAAGFTTKDTPYAIERNPAKVGKMFSALGIPIISEEQARLDKPDAMIIGPWFFADEIIAREQDYLNNGGVLIKPLPKVEIINGN